MANKLSIAELETLIASVVEDTKLSNTSFVETRNNVVGLLDKIGKIITLDSVFAIDKLARFDGEYLSFGKTIEDWYQDLELPTAYDSDGAGALTPNDPSYRPVAYSYTLGRKKIKTTLRNDNIERAVHFEEQLVSIVAMQTKRLEDSMAQYRYGVKRQMIAEYIGLAEDEMGGDNTSWSTSSAYSVNALVKGGSPTAYGIVVKALSASHGKSWAQAVADGYVIVLDLITELAKPVDTSTGEAFIKQVKQDIELANDISEGHSLNGNTLGVSEDLVLVVKQGVIPALEVDTYAGAFHRDDVAVPAEIVVVKDFGDADADYYAVLLDGRGMKLHNTYNATRENVNGDGDFLNIFRHTEDTGYLCRNTFFKAYKVPQA